MKVAIIGAGNVGKALGTSITRAGHEVTISARTPEHARMPPPARSAPTRRDSNADAVTDADVVILAIPYAGAGEAVAAEIADEVAGKTDHRRHQPDQARLLGTRHRHVGRRGAPAAPARRARRQGLQHDLRDRTRRTRARGRSTATSPATTTKAKARGDLAGRVDRLDAARRRTAELGPLPRGDGVHQHRPQRRRMAGAGPPPGSWSANRMPINRLNHAVLFVRDADAAAEFYRRAFGFEELSRPQGMRAAFMRSPSGGNHHDLGLFEVGAQAARDRRAARSGSTTSRGRSTPSRPSPRWRSR